MDKQKNTKIIIDCRKDRGKTQRIFLVHTHNYDDSDIVRSYDVMGTTGNLYTVTIKDIPTCTCPDYSQRQKRCKHIYFVLTRIMKVKPKHEDMATYSSKDLCDMFENIPQITDNLRVSGDEIKTYIKKTNKFDRNHKMQEIDENTLCPICLENMEGSFEPIIYCKYSCGTPIHKECSSIYHKHTRTKECCIVCKVSMTEPSDTYINLKK